MSVEEKQASIEDILDDIEEYLGDEGPVEEGQLDEMIAAYHDARSERDEQAYAQDYMAYVDGYDEGQADVALDLLLALPEFRAKELVQDLAHRLQWALVVVDEDDLVEAWESVYVEPPSPDDLEGLYREAFWPVWAESEMKLAAREVLQSLVAPDPEDDFDPVEEELDGQAWLPLDDPSSSEEVIEAPF